MNRKAREKLERGNLTILEVDPLWRPAQFPQWEFAYTRLRLWELVDYDEIVAMDADVAVISFNFQKSKLLRRSSPNRFSKNGFHFLRWIQFNQ